MKTKNKLYTIQIVIYNDGHVFDDIGFDVICDSDIEAVNLGLKHLNYKIDLYDDLDLDYQLNIWKIKYFKGKMHSITILNIKM